MTYEFGLGAGKRSIQRPEGYGEKMKVIAKEDDEKTEGTYAYKTNTHP